MSLSLPIPTKETISVQTKEPNVSNIMEEVLNSLERTKQALDIAEENNTITTTITNEEQATHMKKHMSKLVQNLRNVKINQVLSKLLEIPNEQEQGDLFFFNTDPKHDPTLHSEEYRHLLRDKKQAERDVVFRVQQLLFKCATTFEKQMKHIETQQKERDMADKLGLVIRGQAETINILQHKLSGWRDAKKNQNQSVQDLHEQTEQLKSKLKTTDIELESWKAKCQRIQSQSEWTADKMQERDTQVHELMGKVGMLTMQMKLAKTRLRRTEENAGVDHAQLLEQTNAAENQYTELLSKNANELRSIQDKANKEYEELSDILSRERERRVQNEAIQSSQIEKSQVESNDLRKYNRDLEVTLEALRKRIDEYEHEKKYGRIQRKFKLSLNKLRLRKNQENNNDTETKIKISPPPIIVEDTSIQNLPAPTDEETVKEDNSDGNDDKNNQITETPETQTEDRDISDIISEESTWDDAQRHKFDFGWDTDVNKREKVSMKIKFQRNIGASELYIKALQYYRPAIDHPTVEALSDMLSQQIIKVAKKREKKYLFGWRYFVEQYKRLVFFKTLTVDSSNSNRVMKVLVNARMDARMAKKQWKILRHQRGGNLWRSIVTGCVDLTNEINGLTALGAYRRKKSKTKSKTLTMDSKLNMHASVMPMMSVALDSVALNIKYDQMAHYDPRTHHHEIPGMQVPRPRTAGHMHRRTKKKSSSRPPFIVPKRPSSAVQNSRGRRRRKKARR